MSFFDEEAAESTSEAEDILAPDSQDENSSFGSSPRPSKRRRLNQPIQRSQQSSTGQTGNTGDHDFPSTHHSCLEERQDKSKPRYLIHVPEYGGPLENTFVTQVDQPLSSPTEIRGPRWQKRFSTQSPSSLPPSAIVPSASYGAELFADDLDDDDPELLAAFLSSPAREKTAAQSHSTSFSSAFGDSARQNRPAPASYRQTTLFGMGSPKTVQAQPSTQSKRKVSGTQSQTHNWPLVNKNEPLTHHKLDHEAITTWVYPTNIGKIRDYQFNIVHKGLLRNLLVALPTGLGKTFIAAAIMLNWFRWTKDAQIVFVAPTKPLVSQQVDACFNIAGIPRSQTTMLVGNVHTSIREEEWKSKRVFFMTPQTLINDLKSGICDPKRIVLVVVDEAHRAKGGYAYVEVVKFLRRFNTSFRVLALTATPGSTVEAVQEVIDGLDIARTEIRTEESIDIREYVHTRSIETMVFDNTDEITMAIDLFASAVRPVMGKLASQNAYWSKDPTSITVYGLQKAREDWAKSPAGRNAPQGLKGMVNSIFSLLMRLASPLELLKFHGIGPFYHKLKGFEEETISSGSKSIYAKQILQDEHFRKLMGRLKTWINNENFEGHPKLTYLKQIIINHFLDAGEGRDGVNGESASNTRIMVFTHYRDSAEEIVRILNRNDPIIRAHVFVGQAASKNSQGMDQKTQLKTIEEFKKGKYNTIVATSIGEEGLDIGEVDLIVCYDCSKSPIRMLQRMGRTGRKRAGNIVLLLMRGKEEMDYEKAKDNYEKMQELIASGKRFEYHHDRSPRILPTEIEPVVDKRQIEIPIENTQPDSLLPSRRIRKNAKRPPKKFHMPDNVDTGFTFLGAGKKEKAKDGRLRNRQSASGSRVDENILASPTLEEVFLSAKEELELEQRYAQIAGTETQIVQIPRLDAFPENFGVAGRTHQVNHSLASLRLVKAYEMSRDPDRDWTRPHRPSTNIFEDDIGDLTTSQPISRSRSYPASRKIASALSVIPLGLDKADGDSSADNFDNTLHLEPSRKRVLVDVEQPFYVSQKSLRDDEELQDALPDINSVFTSKSAMPDPSPQPTRARGTQGRPTAIRRVLYDDDDDDI